MSTSKGAEAKIGLAKAAETKSVGKLTINENREASRPRINAAFAASLNRLEQHYKAVISLATIQILVAILGIAWQCHAGFYTVGVNSGYNTFWVAGPVSLEKLPKVRLWSCFIQSSSLNFSNIMTLSKMKYAWNRC